MTSVGCFCFSILLGKYYSFIYDSYKHTQPSHRLTCKYTQVHIHTHTDTDVNPNSHFDAAWLFNNFFKYKF